MHTLNNNLQKISEKEQANGYAGINASGKITKQLSDINGVTLTSPVTDQILKYNGSVWVNGDPTVIAAPATVDFYLDETNIIPILTNENINQVNTLTHSPLTTTEIVDSIVTASGTVLGETYLFPTALNRTTLDAGTWDFSFYLGVDAATGITKFTHKILRVRDEAGTVSVTGTLGTRTVTASTGTPFATSKIDIDASVSNASYLQTPKGLYKILSRVSDTEITIEVPTLYSNESTVAFSVYKKLFSVDSNEINNIATSPLFAGLQLYETESVQSAFTVLATDKISMQTIAFSDSNRTVYFAHNGNSRYSHFHSPLSTGHNDLAGIQGGTAGEYFHLTTAQLATVGAGTSKAKTSAADTTEDYLAAKIIAGSNVTVTESSSGSRTLTIASNQVESSLSLQTAHALRIEMMRIMSDSDISLTPVVDITKYQGDILTDSSGSYNKVEVGGGTTALYDTVNKRYVPNHSAGESATAVTNASDNGTTVQYDVAILQDNSLITSVKLWQGTGGTDTCTIKVGSETIAAISQVSSSGAIETFAFNAGHYSRLLMNGETATVYLTGTLFQRKAAYTYNGTNFTITNQQVGGASGGGDQAIPITLSTLVASVMKTVVLFGSGNNITSVYSKLWKLDNGTDLITYDVSVDNDANYATGKSLDTLYTLSANLGNQMFIKYNIPAKANTGIYGFSIENGRA